MLYIGIDLGTSSVKLLLMNDRGEIERTAVREYPLSFPHPGWSEQSPEDWYDATLEAMDELLADMDCSCVRGLSVGGQMHGLVMLDEEDKVIRPAILWNDGRTARETEELNRDPGIDKLIEYTGNIAFAGFTAPKLLWVKKNEPENFARIAKIMLPKDYLTYRLTGSFVTDYSDASGMLLLDVGGKTWSDPMCEICGIKKEMLPRLCESYEAVGVVKPELASRFGLADDVVCAAGAGDNAAAAVGTGTVGEGRCNISLGTSGTLFISSERFAPDHRCALHAFDHADGNFHLMGCMLSAASCNQWWMRDILNTKEYSKEQEGITELGKNPVFFLPYLMGERSPWNDPAARACFVGMSMDTPREAMTQAVLEGVAFAVRDMYEAAAALGVKPQRSMICGGGAKSPLWRKIMANVLGIPLDVPVSEKGPGMGAAMLAMVAEGVYPNVAAACDAIVKVRETEEPDAELTALYEKRYQQFKKLYPALKQVFADAAAN